MASDREMGELSPGLRERVADEMVRFTEALDAAIANSTPETLERLRDAADQVMRATARVLLELERVSAT